MVGTMTEKELIELTPPSPEPPHSLDIYTDTIHDVRRNSWRHGWAEGYRAALSGQATPGTHTNVSGFHSSSTNALDWAAEFKRQNPEADEVLMRVWFSSAIFAGCNAASGGNV